MQITPKELKLKNHELIKLKAQIKELSFEEQANFNLFLAEHNLPPAGYQTLQITYF